MYDILQIWLLKKLVVKISYEPLVDHIQIWHGGSPDISDNLPKFAYFFLAVMVDIHDQLICKYLTGMYLL